MNSIEMLSKYGSPEFVDPGHMGCPGCGLSLGIRECLKALGDDIIMYTVPGCTSVALRTNKVRRTGSAFDVVASTAAGLRKALDIRGDNRTVVIWAGDGATFDAGFIGLSACAERNEDYVFICYDNEGYMNTGNQRSSATPWGANTYTTPGVARKVEEKKNVVEILASHYVPYAATASLAYPADLHAKLLKAKAMKGFRFIHLYSPCPTGWGSDSALSIEISRMAVQNRMFPLYEVEDGERYRITVNPDPMPVDQYITAQGRFRTVTHEEMAQIQSRIDRQWKMLVAKSEIKF